MNLNNLAEKGLTGNQLKLIAMISMTLDHIGMMLLPRWTVLRILGRLAMPIYAYMIAEGCRHTRNRKRYFLRIAGLAAVCQVAYFFAMGSLYMCILVTFSLSILLIGAVENYQMKRDRKSQVLAFVSLLAVFFLCVALPELLPGTDFGIDYGIAGVLLPVLVYFGTEKTKYLTAGLILLGFGYGGIQWCALAAVPLLGMYNGQRGRGNVGKWFYLFYPAHLLVLEGLSMIL